MSDPMKVKFNNIPLDIRNTGRRWVVWRGSKVPYGKHYNDTDVDFDKHVGLAKVNDPATWLTYNEAKYLYEKGSWGGIGIVLTRDLGMVGVDLDSCIVKGEIIRHQKAISLMQEGFYVEYSPSGNGIRGFAYGKLAGDRRKDGAEMYDGSKGRYLTVTGRMLHNNLDECQGRIDAIYRSCFNESPKVVDLRPNYLISGNRGSENVTDEDLWEPLQPNIAMDLLEHVYADRVGIWPPGHRLYKEREYQSQYGDNPKSLGWLNVGMALKDNANKFDNQWVYMSALDPRNKVDPVPADEAFFRVWDKWSATDPARYKPALMRAKWKSFAREGGKLTSIGSLILCGREGGWTRDIRRKS